MVPCRRLDEVCDLIMGQAPDGTSYNLEGKGWPLIAGAGDFEGVHPAPKRHTCTASKLSLPGDIVLGIRATIGEKVLSDGVYCLGRGVAGLRVKGDLHARYLWHWLTHINSELISKAKGATFKQVTREDIAALRISVPPLAEQRRIAAILDKADELRAKRRHALTKMDSLSDAIFFDSFGDPRRKTEWPVVSLGELCVKLVDGCHKTPTYVVSGVPFITVSNIVSGRLDLTQTKFISPNEHAVLTKRVKPERGDILVSKDGTIGVPCPIETDREFSIFVSVALLKIRHEAINQLFLTKQLGTEWIQAQIRAGTKGIAIRHLHLNDFKKLRILLPPLPLQEKFVRRITALEELRTAHRASLAEMDALFSSLQHRAFRGEL